MAISTKPRNSGDWLAELTSKDKALLKRAAGLKGCSVGAFVASHVRAAAEKVVQDNEVIRLTAKESRRFVEAVLAPPRPPTRRMQNALALYRETVSER